MLILYTTSSTDGDYDFDPCMLCSGEGLILVVRDGEHLAVAAHFLGEFAIKPILPPSSPPFWLCRGCQTACVTLSRVCESVCERRANGGTRRRGRKPKRPRTQTEKGYGFELPQSSTTLSSPLDRRRTSTYSVHPISPVPFLLDEETVSEALLTYFDGYQTDGDGEHQVEPSPFMDGEN